MFLFSADPRISRQAESRVDFERNVALRFDFLRHLHKDMQPVVARLLRSKHRGRVADLAASVMTIIGESHAASLDLDTDTERYFRDVLVDQGFHPITDERIVKLSATVPDDSLSRVLLAGCQNEEILGARVARCVDVAARLTSPTEIVFSGRNPGGQAAYLTVDEAAWMEQRFFELTRDDPRFDRKPVTTRLETQSRRSEENVINFFEQPPCSTAARVAHVYLVSSMSHVSRLARIAATYIREKSLAVEQLIVVGSGLAENATPEARTKYLKSAAYEMYSDLLGRMSQKTPFTSSKASLRWLSASIELTVSPTRIVRVKKVSLSALRDVKTIELLQRITGVGRATMELGSAGILEGPRAEVDRLAWKVVLPGDGLRKGDTDELHSVLTVDDPTSSMQPFFSLATTPNWAGYGSAAITVRFVDWRPSFVHKHIESLAGHGSVKTPRVPLELDSEQAVHWEIEQLEERQRYIITWEKPTDDAD